MSEGPPAPIVQILFPSYFMPEIPPLFTDPIRKVRVRLYYLLPEPVTLPDKPPPHLQPSTLPILSLEICVGSESQFQTVSPITQSSLQRLAY